MAAHPLGDLIDRCLGPTLAAQGFAASDVLVAWAEIVGPRLAAHTRPIKIEWPRRRRDDEPAAPATLVVRSTSAFAIELQHSAPQVIERVNTHFGWRCVGRLVIRQGPVHSEIRKAAPATGPDEATRAAVAGTVAGIGDEPLRAALERLGLAVMTRRPR